MENVARDARGSLFEWFERVFVRKPAPLVAHFPAPVTAPTIEIPTQPELELDGTRASMGAVRMLAHALASIIERRTGTPTTASEVLNDARGLAIVFCNHYRGIARRGRS